MRTTLALALAVSLGTPATARADDSCTTGFRAAFGKLTAPARRVQEAVHARLNRKGRAQAEAVQRILEEKGGDVASWENDVLERMSDRRLAPRNYPSLDELLALMAARSPTFKGGLTEFLADHGQLRFKVLSGFMQRRGSKGSVSYGAHFWNLWQARIRLPTREAWTADDFALFMSETSNAMFRALHPEPGFASTWLKAFGDFRLDADGWRIWRKFADRVLVDYRGRYLDFMEGVTTEAYGEPRPEVIADFYKWGPWDAIYRRIARLAQPGDETEVERLSLELMWFIKPVLEGAILYTTVIDPAAQAYHFSEARKRFESNVRAHPERYLPRNQRADDDRIANLNDQIKLLAAEKGQLEKELGQVPPLIFDEQTQRRRAIDRIDHRVAALESLKGDLLSGVHEVHG